MKLSIKKYIVHPIIHPIRIAIPAFQGLALHLIKLIIKGPRFFFPRERKFYYPKEQAVHKAAMEVKKNSFPGLGPPL